MVTAEAGAAMLSSVIDTERAAPIPGQQRGRFVDLVIGDPGRNVSKPSLRIDAVELGPFPRHPVDELASQRCNVLPARRKPFIRRRLIDRPLGHEDGIDLLHRFQGHRRDRGRLVVARLRRDIAKLEDLAPAVRPASASPLPLSSWD